MEVNSEVSLLARKSEFANLVRQRLDPDVWSVGGNERLRMVFDLEMHLAFLGEAVRCDASRIFIEYAIWTNQLLLGSGGDSAIFRACLLAIEAEIHASGRGEWVLAARQCLAEALRQLDIAQPASQTYLTDDNPYRVVAEAFMNDCLSLRREQALEKIKAVVEAGTSVRDVYCHIIAPVMHELGRLWHLNRITIGQEHYCTAVAQMLMAQLFPLLFDAAPKKKRLVSTCVAGELHEIGARMISDMFELNGWDTVFLGADVPVDSVVDMLGQHQASVLAISVTLAANLSAVSNLVAAVRARPECAAVKILVGGAAFNGDETLWKKLGADGWAEDFTVAINLASSWSA